MNKWQKEVFGNREVKDEKVINEIKGQYKQALKDIDDKIAQLMGRNEKENLQSIIYQVDYQKSLKTQISAILDDLNSKQFETISQYLEEAYEDGFIGTLYDLQKQGIPLIFPIDQQQVIRALKTDSKLSKSLYASLGEDINELKSKVRAEVSRGISQNYSYSQIAKNLAAQTSIGYNKAVRIARTEGHRINQEATFDAQVKAKEEGADIVKQWDAALDKRTRRIHSKLDGQIREIDEPFEYNGHEAMHPGAFGVPELDINCRCVITQRAKRALDEEELETLKKRAEYYGLDKTEDFEDFKSKYLQAANSEELKSGIIPVKTREEAIKALSEKVGFKNIKLDRIDDELLIAQTNQLQVLEDKFGAIHLIDTDCIDTNRGKYLACARYQISGGNYSKRSLEFNIKHFGKGKKDLLIANERKWILDGWSMPIEMTEQNLLVNTVTHEYGHILQYSYFSKKLKEITLTKTRINYSYEIDLLEKKCRSEIIRIAKEINPNLDLKSSLSQYGKTNGAEFFAEVFANSQLGAPNELGQAMNIWLEREGLIKK